MSFDYQAVQGRTEKPTSTNTKLAVEYDSATFQVDDPVDVNDTSWRKLAKGHGRLLVNHRKFELTERTSTGAHLTSFAYINSDQACSLAYGIIGSRL